MDVEIAFIEDHTTVMAALADVLCGMLASVRTKAAGAIATLDVRMPDLPRPIPALHFTEALELIGRMTGEETRGTLDLTPTHERWLGQWTQREYGSEYLFVTGFPMETRPFYTHSDMQRPTYSNSFDLLFRGTELVTGGQRLHMYEDYLSALRARGLSAEPLAGYLETFRHGMPPHGGFAIGLERWVASLVGASNIRQVTLFPRDRNRLSP